MKACPLNDGCSDKRVLRWTTGWRFPILRWGETAVPIWQWIVFATTLTVSVCWPNPLTADVQQIRFTDSRQRSQTVIGEVVVQARNGGLFVQADDGQIWLLQPEQIQERSTLSEPLEPISADEAARRLLDEMPEGFKIHRTSNYLICHNTNPKYASYVGGLFEQLYRGFFAYWKGLGWELDTPRFPLVALVFADQDGFQSYAGHELGDTVKSVIGYYHLETNRMTTYFLPNAERNVATIIHEATHQLAYNSGLQRRFADNPMWVSEGLAMFFESPDFSSPRGWRSVGKVNRVNLERFRRYVPSRPADSLRTLLADDARLRDSSQALMAYGESWALTYFLLKTRRKEFVAYLQQLSAGEPLQQRSPQERIEMLETALDIDLETLDRRFVPYMMRLR